VQPECTSFIFIGRRQRVKGFDELIEGFRLARNINKQIMLYIAGSGGSLQGEDGIVDLGVVTNPLAWMRSVDALVSVNRQSYFDRVVIEALSVGANLLVSCTYGHTELANQSSDIVDLSAPSPESICRGFLKIAEHGFPAQSRADNMSIYWRRYSDRVHRQRLEELLTKYNPGLLQRGIGTSNA